MAFGPVNKTKEKDSGEEREKESLVLWLLFLFYSLRCCDFSTRECMVRNIDSLILMYQVIEFVYTTTPVWSLSATGFVSMC